MALLLAPLFFFFESIYGKCERLSNVIFVWTIGNHTERLSPTESFIMDKKTFGQLPTSASTHLLSPHLKSNRGLSSAEPWTDLYECAWFRSLVWLIYLLNLAIATNILWVFPFTGNAALLEFYIGSTIQFYSSWFGFDLAVLLLFTITSLSLCHAQDTSELRWTWRAEMHANWYPSKRTKLIQQILLIVSVFVLAASSAMFGWLLLLFPPS